MLSSFHKTLQETHFNYDWDNVLVDFSIVGKDINAETLFSAYANQYYSNGWTYQALRLAKLLGCLSCFLREVVH